MKVSAARRRLPLPAAVLLTAVLLVTVVGGVVLSLSRGGHDRIYDDPEALGGRANSYSALLFTNSGFNDSYSGSVGRLSGVHEIFTLTVQEETQLTLQFALETTAGKAKLIWADPEGNVTTLQECLAQESGEGTMTVTLPAGVNRFKVAGAQKAACSWSIEAL